MCAVPRRDIQLKNDRSGHFSSESIQTNSLNPPEVFHEQRYPLRTANAVFPGSRAVPACSSINMIRTRPECCLFPQCIWIVRNWDRGCRTGDLPSGQVSIALLLRTRLPELWIGELSGSVSRRLTRKRTSTFLRKRWGSASVSEIKSPKSPLANFGGLRYNLL